MSLHQLLCVVCPALPPQGCEPGSYQLPLSQLAASLGPMPAVSRLTQLLASYLTQLSAVSWMVDADVRCKLSSCQLSICQLSAVSCQLPAVHLSAVSCQLSTPSCPPVSCHLPAVHLSAVLLRQNCSRQGLWPREAAAARGLQGHCTLPCTALHCTALLQCTVDSLHCIALTALHCTALHCTVCKL